MNIEDLKKKNREAMITESMRFDPLIDLEIIMAHENRRPSLYIKPTPIPLYRCYFFENQVIVTYLTHLLNGEYETFKYIVEKSFIFEPNISLYVLTGNDVVLERSINAKVLAHILFRFHHRIAKKYLSEESFLY